MRQNIFEDLVELRQNWRSLALCLIIAAIGALVAIQITMPLPWMLGPIIFTGIAAMAGLKVWVPMWLRTFMFIFIGMLFGTTVPLDIGDQVVSWWPSIAGILAYVILVTGLVYVYLRRVVHLDGITAYFSAAPGGLLPMTVIGGSYGGDERIISLMQTARLMITVLIIPISFRLFGGYVPTGAAATDAHFVDVSLPDAGLMVLASIISIPIARLLRLPTPALIGPMIAVAALTIGGVVHSPLPDPLVAIAQLVIGANVGAMFNGIRIREVAGTLFQGSIAGVIMVVLAVLAALLIAPVSGWLPEALILGYAPGGFAEMALIGFALGIEVTFVVGHQMIRFLFIVGCAPPVIAAIKRHTSFGET